MEKFDDIIKDKIFDMEVTPPAGLWHQISDKLDSSEQGIAAPVKERGKSISLVWIARIAAVFIGLVAIGLNLMNKETTAVANNDSAAVSTAPANTIQQNTVPAVTYVKTQVAVKEDKAVEQGIENSKKDNNRKSVLRRVTV